MDSLILVILWYGDESTGYVFRSNTDLRMERREKSMEAMGIEGRQATLPRESSTHEEERGWSHGRLRIPLSINQSSKVNCSGDSIAPTTDFSSVVFCSNSKNESFSLLEGNLFFMKRIFMYISVGMSGNSKTNIIIFRSSKSLLLCSPKYFFLKLKIWMKTGMTGSQTIPLTTKP